MKKVLFFFLSISLCIQLNSQTEKKIVILHTNDMHSRLTGFAPESAYSPLVVNNDKTVGGFARIATLIKEEKNINELTLVVDGGDFLMGTLFHSLEVETGFQLRLMKKMGYDVTCFGNHEFDFGPDKLAAIINNSVKGGDIPGLLTGNSVFSLKDSRDDSLEELYKKSIISRKIIITKGDLKVGFFSLIGKDADNVAPNAAPIEFSKQSSFAKKMVKDLKDEKCDIIICISHSGLSKDKNGQWSGEDYKIAKSVKGIDIIISGHTHTLLEQPLIINGIPIVQAGEYGKYVGRIALTYSGNSIKVDDYRLIPVDDKIMGDRTIDQLIEEQKTKISDEILKPLGMDYNRAVVETNFRLEGNETGNFLDSNVGPLIADAIHSYVNNHSKEGTDISMVAAGVIRDEIVPGIQAAPDIFRVMSLGYGKDNVPGYPLARLYVTGKELKSILEILQVAYKSSPDNYCYYSGLRAQYYPEKGLLRKIKKVEILKPDGRVINVDFSKKNSSLYSVTANSYMLEFFGIIKKMSFGLINVVPKDSEGKKVIDMKSAVIDMDPSVSGIQEGKEWLALMEYLSSMKDTNGNGIPDIDRKYSVPIRCFFQVNPN